MATSSRSAERFKYGICLNDECPLCKEKKVQQIPMRKDLVCSECGKPLRECPPPRKKGVDSKLIGIIAAILIVLAGAGFGIYSSMGGTKIDKIMLDKDSVSLSVGKKAVIKPTALDKDSKEIKDAKITYKWTVKDEEVASVTQSGEVTALKEGNTSITVVIEGSEELTATCQVVVKPKKIPGSDPIYISQLSLKDKNVTLKKGDTKQLDYVAVPEQNSETIAWESSDPSIVTVENGLVTAIKKGNAQIIAKASKVTSTPITVTVQEDGINPPPPSNDGNGWGKENLGYGIYEGYRKNHKPHGHGTIRYTQPHKIVSWQNYEASPGDTFEGEFRDGKISGLGYWKHNGNVTAIQ
jgi:uncharacterized protein YjdB